MISGLIRGGRASIQSIGKHMDAGTDLEIRVKQAKRWLSSKWTDAQAHFIPYLAPVIRSLSKSGELVLAITYRLFNLLIVASLAFITAFTEPRQVEVRFFETPRKFYFSEMFQKPISHPTLPSISASTCTAS
ncbi:MAG: hypothetical protein J5I98_14150 [Phaeodactylibacter sp.]|nr:hypothetical protein [Phaeodactylibacter sp.]